MPLLLVKLWTVYPQAVPAAAGAAPAGWSLDALERVSIAVLVAAAIFQLATGLANSPQWYPWAFSFRATHYAVAWVAIGALVVHIAVKLPIIRRALTADVERPSTTGPRATEPGALTRRGLLRTTWLGLRRRGARDRRQHRAAGCARSRSSPSAPATGRRACRSTSRPPRRTSPTTWSGRRTGSTVAYGDRERRCCAARTCRRCPSATESLPIACVEGWSAERRVDRRPGARPARPGRRADGPRRRRQLAAAVGSVPAHRAPGNFADDDRTLLALALNGEPLALDHGYPARLIAPNRPGVLQTKWVSRLEVLA